MAAPAPLQIPVGDGTASAKKKKESKSAKEPKESKEKDKKEPKTAEKGKKSAPPPKSDQRGISSFFKKVEKDQKHVDATCDFDQRFQLPIWLKAKDTLVAPVNWFRGNRELGLEFDGAIESQGAQVKLKEWAVVQRKKMIETELQSRRRVQVFSEEDGVVQLDAPISAANVKSHRLKLLQFKSSLDLGIRPPYWGKSSAIANPMVLCLKMRP